MYTPKNLELFHRFLERMPIAVAMFDRQMRYLLTNRQWLNDYGLGEQEIIGRSQYEVFPELPEDWQEIYQRCLAGAVERCGIDCLSRTDGSVLWFKWEIHPWHQQNDEIGGIIMFTEVLTPAKRTEEALQGNDAKFQKLAANVPGVIYQLLLSADGSISLPYVNPGCRDLCGYEPEQLQQDANLFFRQIHPDDRKSFDALLAVSAQTRQPWSWMGRLITASGRVKWLQAVARPERQDRGDMLWDGLLLDITERKQVEEQLRLYQEHLEEVVVDRTAELTKVNEQLQQQIAERHHTEAQLRQSQQLYQTLAQLSPVGFFHTDAQGQCVYVNERWSEMSGIPFEAALKEGWTAGIHPQDRERVYKEWCKATQECFPFKSEFRWQRSDGTVIWTLTEALPLRTESGDVIAYMGTLTDITERKHTEETLQPNEVNFQKLAGNIPGMIYQYRLGPDGAQSFPYVSPGCGELYELEPEEVQQNIASIFDLIEPEDRLGLEQSIAASAQTLEPWNYEWQMSTPSGQTKWAQGIFRPEKQANGDILWDGLLLDITERKRSEAALQESYTLLRSLMENTPDMVFAKDLQGRFVTLNSSFADFMGEPIEELIGKDDTQFFPAETAQQIQKKDRRIMTTGMAETFEEVVPNNGGLQTLLTTKSPWRDRDGNIIGLIGIARDITELKQAEEERQKFVSLVENSTDFIGIASLEGQAIFLNAAGQKMVGLSGREEVKTKTMFDFLMPEDLEEFHEQVLPTVMDHGYWQSEFRLKHFPTGNPILTDFNFFLIRNSETGQPLAYATVTRDISERKQAEKTLRQSEARYRELAQREKLLNRLASQIRGSLDLNTILETAVQEIYKLLQPDRCIFQGYRLDALAPYWEVIQEARNLELPSLLGLRSLITEVDAQVLDQPITRVNDVKTLSDPEEQQFFISCGYTAVLALPLRTQSGEVGLISCSHSSRTRVWSDAEVEWLQAVADQLAIAIEQAELYKQSRTAAAIAQAQAQQLEQTLKELQRTQTQLVQTEKMSSLGQLVAGVAHEINNPVNFIYGNLVHASEYAHDLLSLVELYQREYPNPTAELSEEMDAIDLGFLMEDLPKLLSSIKVGAQRIREIVRSLRNFSRLDEAQMKEVDIHDGIESTLMILQNRLKAKPEHPGIQVIKEYGNLPLVECYPGQLNQVFMNLLTNALDALDEYNNQPSADYAKATPSIIRIQTALVKNLVVIRIADNGPGMTEDVRQRLFDPFFTTKPIGQGTGLGLSISYQIVVEKHYGQLYCNSQLGKGTEFVIEIPLRQSLVPYSEGCCVSTATGALVQS